MARPSRRQRGVMLVLTLWLAAVLAVIAYSLAYEVRLNAKMSAMASNRLQARAIARAGLARAVIDLKNDQLLTHGYFQGFLVDTREDLWAQSDNKTEVEWGEDGSYTVRIHDEESRININRLPVHARQMLEHLLTEYFRVRPEEAQLIVDGIIDYRDADLTPLSGMGGSPREGAQNAEIQYYTRLGWRRYGSLLPANWRFRPKNDRFMHLEELLEIPGITRQMLYGDPEASPLDRFNREPAEMIRRPALVDLLTVHSSGALNINTCSAPVLEALIVSTVGADADVRGLVREILDYRERRHTYNAMDCYGFAHVNQLEEVGIDRQLLVRLNTMSQIRVNSEVFTIVARGTYRGVTETFKAQVSCSSDVFPIRENIPLSRGRRGMRHFGFLKNQPNMKIDPAIRVRQFHEL